MKRILLVFILLSITGYYFYQKYQSTPRDSQLNITPVVSETPKSPKIEHPPEIPSITPSTNTQEWQTYSNPLLHMTLKYPSEYKVDYIQGQPYLNRTITWWTTATSFTEM
jgi:hypothetical protein